MRPYPLVRCAAIAVTIVFSALFFAYAPSKGTSDDDRPTIATERWESTADHGNGKGIWVFSKKSDGAMSATGEWTYVNSIKCPFNEGIMILSGASLSFSVTGTATNPSAPPGFQDSPFTLEVKGELRDGKGRGTYVIAFSGPGWPSGFSGKWTATRTGGKSVSE